MEKTPTQPHTGTEKLEKELADKERILKVFERKATSEQRKENLEGRREEIEAIRAKIEQKKESSKERGEKGVERVEKSGGEPEDVADAENAGEILNTKTEEVAEPIEAEYLAMEAGQKAAKSVEGELRSTVDIVMDKYKAEKPTEEVVQTAAAVSGAEAEKPKEGTAAGQNESINRVTVRRSDGRIEDDWTIVGGDQKSVVVLKDDPDRPGMFIQKTISLQEVEELSNARITFDNFGKPRIVRRLFPFPKAEKLSEEGEMVAQGEQEVKLDDASEKKIEQEAEEIKKELEEMPAEKLEEIGVGLHNFGFFAKEYKSQVMAGIFESAGDKKQAQEAEGFTGSVKRWMQGYAQSYRKDELTARKNIEETKKEMSLKQVGNVGFIAGETMKHGRTVADILGWTAGSPLRYAMFGAQIFSRTAEAAKEGRLMNAEVIEKTRIQDMDEAANEAWKIYENAQAKAEEKGEKVSKQDWGKAYVENLPEDLLKRLEKSEPGMATGILQRVLKKDLEFAIKHGKIKIGEDGKVEKLFENSFNDRLKEYDRLISQYGTVDALAMGAKYAETAGKAVIAAVSIETAILGVKALFDRFPDIMGRLAKTAGGALAGGLIGKKAGGKRGAIMGAAMGAVFGAASGADAKTLAGLSEEDILHRGLGLATEAKPSLGVHNVVDIEKPAVSPVSEKLGELSESAVVQKGEGIEHAFIRQLIDDPEKFGYDGPKNDEALTDWAGKEAHRIAIKAGYVDMKTGSEIRVGGKGSNVAYELEKGPSGNIKVNEYSKDAEGNFQGEETNEVAKDFKSAQFETERESYEYEHEKPVGQEIVPGAPKSGMHGSAKIDEYYAQRIAKQERLGGIKNAEMVEKSEYFDQKIAEQERLKDIKRAGMVEKSEYYDQKIAEQERLKDIARATKAETVENAQPKVSAEPLHTEEPFIHETASVEQAPKTGLGTEVKAPVVEHAPEVKVENIVTKTEEAGGNVVETAGVTAEIKGSTGQEFLSKDYMLKLKPSIAGAQFARTEAMMTSRSITARLGAYHELLATGKTEEAAKHLDALRKSLDMADKSLGAGVIDRSKIPELK